MKVVDFYLPEEKEREEAEAASADPRAAERGGIGPDFAAGGILMEVDRPGGAPLGAGLDAAGGEHCGAGNGEAPGTGPSGGDSFGGWVPDASDASVGPNARGPLSPSEAAPHWTPTRTIAFISGGGNSPGGAGSPAPPGRPRVAEAAEGPVMALPASGPRSAFGGLKGGAGGASLASDPDLPSGMAAGYAPAVPGGNGSSGAGAGEGSGEADWGSGPGLGETFCPGAFPPILEVVPGKRMKVEEVAPSDAEAEMEGEPAAATAAPPTVAAAAAAATGGGLLGGQGGAHPPT